MALPDLRTGKKILVGSPKCTHQAAVGSNGKSLEMHQQQFCENVFESRASRARGYYVRFKIETVLEHSLTDVTKKKCAKNYWKTAAMPTLFHADSLHLKGVKISKVMSLSAQFLSLNASIYIHTCSSAKLLSLIVRIDDTIFSVHASLSLQLTSKNLDRRSAPTFQLLSLGQSQILVSFLLSV